jgi:putative membrane protein
MISYNPKDWITFIFDFTADTFRKLFPLMVLIGLYAAAGLS